MYAVIHKDSGRELSYHKTVKEALDMILTYERADGMKGEYVPDSYDWKVVDDE